MIVSFKKIHEALNADFYIFQYYSEEKGTQYPFFTKKNAENEILIKSPFTQNDVWQGWSFNDFIKKKHEILLKKIQKGYKSFALRLYPTSDTGYIVIDDINTKEKLEKSKTYDFALLVESSPNNYQGVLKIIMNSSEKEDLEALKLLSQKLNKDFGDLSVKVTSQSFRLPRTLNNKPEHITEENPDGFLVKLVYAKDVYCDKAQQQFNDIAVNLFSKKPKFYSKLRDLEEKHGIFESFKPQTIYRAYAQTVANKLRLAGRELDRISCALMRANGYNIEQIRIVIQYCCYKDNADLRGKWNGKTEEYKSRDTFSHFAEEYAKNMAKSAFTDSFLIEFAENAPDSLLVEAERKLKYYSSK